MRLVRYASVILSATLCACTPEEVTVQSKKLDFDCPTRWLPCEENEDLNGDGIQNLDEAWTGICTAEEQCTPCNGPCAALLFLGQPSDVILGQRIAPPIVVEIRDPLGTTMVDAPGVVSIRLVSPPLQAEARGTLDVAFDLGKAVFDDVSITRAGGALTLRAAWEGASDAVSEPFAVSPACAASMTGYWPLDELSGNTFVNLAGGDAAGCTSCPTYDETEAAWRFDSTASTGIDVPGTVASAFNWGVTDSLAVEIWIRSDPSACATGTNVIIGRDGGAANLHWWLGCRGTGRVLGTSWYDTTDTNAGLDGPLLDDSSWHHVVFQRRVAPPRRSLVVDGALVAVMSTTLGGFDDPPDAPLNIGWMDLGGGYHYTGHIAHVALYDRTLAESEVLAHRDLDRAATYCDVVGPVCGDGAVHPGEECDDSNTTAGDGCSPLCRREEVACPADLIAYWRLDGTGLARFDDRVGGLHLDCSIRGEPACPAATIGIVDGGQAFDGIVTALELAAPAVVALDWAAEDSWSVELWMRTEVGATCTGNEVLIGRRDGVASSYWWLGCVEGGTARADIRGTGGVADSLSGPPITDGGWHHLVLAHDATADTATLYVDGASVDSMTLDAGTGFAFDESLEIGRFATSYYYEGALDAVAVYDRALPLSEVEAHWASGQGQDYCAR